MDEKKKRPLPSKVTEDDQVVDDEDDDSESGLGDSSSIRSVGLSEPEEEGDRKVAARPASDDADGDGHDNNEDDNEEGDDDDAQEGPSNKKRMRTSSGGRPENKVSHEQRWNEMFTRVLAFKEKHGHCLVPNRYSEDTQLGFWVSAQRRQYKLLTTQGESASALTPERIRKLESIGFQWSSTNPHHTPWETRYKELCDFVKKYGHAEVPIRWKENPKLSHWVSKQRHDMKLRQQGRSCRLSDRKVKALNEVGFLWEGDKRSRRNLREKTSLGEASSDGATSDGPLSPSGDTSNLISEANSAPGLGVAAPAPDNSAIPPQSNSGQATAMQNPFVQILGGAGMGNMPPGQQPLVAAIILPIQTYGQPQPWQPIVAQPVVGAPPAGPQSNPTMNMIFNMLAGSLAPMLMQQPQQSQALMASLAPHVVSAQQPLQQPGMVQSLEQQLQLMFSQGAAPQPAPPVAPPHQQQQQPQQQPQLQQQTIASGLNQEPFLQAIQQALTGVQQAPVPAVGTAASPAAQQLLVNNQHLSGLLQQLGVPAPTPNYTAPSPSGDNSGIDPPSYNQNQGQQG